LYIWPILALLFAALEALAVHQERRELEFIAKPGVILVLMIWLYAATGWQGNALWFGLGLLFSLLGDLLLLFLHPRMFLSGLAAFLLTHVCYLVGFQDQLLHPGLWSFLLLIFILWNGIRLLRRIVGALRARQENRLVYPVTVYGLVISLMLFAAFSTIFDPAWGSGAAFLVSAGAFLFWISDLMLAWNKFVSPLSSGRLPILVAYQLGQISLIAGVIRHFG
jgi:uncharacterized membrane protein YhhN